MRRGINYRGRRGISPRKHGRRPGFYFARDNQGPRLTAASQVGCVLSIRSVVPCVSPPAKADARWKITVRNSALLADFFRERNSGPRVLFFAASCWAGPGRDGGSCAAIGTRRAPFLGGGLLGGGYSPPPLVSPRPSLRGCYGVRDGPCSGWSWAPPAVLLGRGSRPSLAGVLGGRGGGSWAGPAGGALEPGWPRVALGGARVVSSARRSSWRRPWGSAAGRVAC